MTNLPIKTFNDLEVCLGDMWEFENSDCTKLTFLVLGLDPGSTPDAPLFKVMFLAPKIYLHKMYFFQNKGRYMLLARIKD